jgi:ApaG protein
MYQHITRHIRINVRPQFLDNQSQPDQRKFVWAYTITVENLSGDTVKLLTRHWIITDGLGHKQEVKGDGVVGEQPTLRPGDKFEYTSGCPLSTPSGVMSGSYGMINAKGEGFDVVIPAFSLDSPYDVHSLN